MSSIPHILYTTAVGSRKMVVVDGQPYYQSTGRNSGCPDMWFPFLMLKGNEPFDFNKLPLSYNEEHIEKTLEDRRPSYIVKLLRSSLEKEFQEVKTHDPHYNMKRNPLKSTLLIAYALTGPDFPLSALRNAGIAEQDIMKRPPIIVESKPEFESNDPDKINQWLIQHDASVAARVIGDERLSASELFNLVDLDVDMDTSPEPTSPINTPSHSSDINFFHKAPAIKAPEPEAKTPTSNPLKK